MPPRDLFRLTLTSVGVDIRARCVSRAVAGELKTTFLREPVVLISVFQRTGCQLIEFTEDAQLEKDRCLVEATKFCNLVKARLSHVCAGALSCRCSDIQSPYKWWFDFSDPVTGAPVYSACGPTLCNDVYYLAKSFGLETTAVGRGGGICNVLTHGSYGVSVYPVLAVLGVEKADETLVSDPDTRPCMTAAAAATYVMAIADVDDDSLELAEVAVIRPPISPDPAAAPPPRTATQEATASYYWPLCNALWWAARMVWGGCSESYQISKDSAVSAIVAIVDDTVADVLGPSSAEASVPAFA